MTTNVPPDVSSPRVSQSDRWPQWTGWERAQYLRERSGLTQIEVAKRAGLSRMWVVLLESGQQTNPKVRAVLAYCKAIGVPIGALL